MYVKIPKFLLYGENDPKVQERIQETLPWRSWDALSREEKEIALQELKNYDILSNENAILEAIFFLNKKFLRKLYGRRLHSCPKRNVIILREEATYDFHEIFLTQKSDVVLFMLSVFAEKFINQENIRQAEKSDNDKDREKYIKWAFAKFDNLQIHLNHIFNQFYINQVLTRNGFIPRQDEKVLDQIYIPTIKCLSDPKWSLVNSDLENMFQDYRNGDYQETITKAHSVIHRFLQISLNKEHKNSKGELGKLFQEAKREDIISDNIFVVGIINTIQSFISSERATGSTAKPASKNVTPSDALLVMNTVMIFLQYCLKAN